MNDAHDNAQADREALKQVTCGDPDHSAHCRHIQTGVIHRKGGVYPVSAPRPPGVAPESEAIRLLKGFLGVAGYPTPTMRDMALVGYSDELKRLILRTIELDPALEDSILQIAETAFMEGHEEGQEL